MDPAKLALLHAAAFTAPPPWPASAFAGCLADPTAFLLVAPDEQAFLLGRVVADEAEILTLATHPTARRQGHARALLARFLAEARRRGAIRAHLEVAEDNTAARALYAGCGFGAAGRRPGYYRAPGGPAIAALILTCALDPASAPLPPSGMGN